jgi:hypothetical protein
MQIFPSFLTSFSEEMLLKALMSKPEEISMRNTVRSPSVPQNMLFSRTFMDFVVDENDHLQENEISPGFMTA